MAGAVGTLVVPVIVPSSVFGKTAPSNKINIAQIGFGRIAMTHDLPETMKNDIVRIIAISDLDTNRLKQGKVWVENRYEEESGYTHYQQ